jgi:hypothetical protein
LAAPVFTAETGPAFSLKLHSPLLVNSFSGAPSQLNAGKIRASVYAAEP